MSQRKAYCLKRAKPFLEQHHWLHLRRTHQSDSMHYLAHNLVRPTDWSPISWEQHSRFLLLLCPCLLMQTSLFLDQLCINRMSLCAVWMCPWLQSSLSKRIVVDLFRDCFVGHLCPGWERTYRETTSFRHLYREVSVCHLILAIMITLSSFWLVVSQLNPQFLPSQKTWSSWSSTS